jgi:RecA/RadA recombinase
MGGICAFIDAENAMDPAYAKRIVNRTCDIWSPTLQGSSGLFVGFYPKSSLCNPERGRSDRRAKCYNRLIVK